MHGFCCPFREEGGAGKDRPRVESVEKKPGTAGDQGWEVGVGVGQVLNAAEIHILVLQESKNENGFVFLEKHILKKKIQRNQTNIYNIIEHVSVGAAWGWAGYSFRWGVLVLFGEKTRRGFLHPLQKTGPVNTGLPEKRKGKDEKEWQGYGTSIILCGWRVSPRNLVLSWR